jgi:NADPH-dependent curcumin reductase CurA
MINEQVILAERPDALPAEKHFALRSLPLPEPESGEALCRVTYLSLDPYMRGQISGRHITGPLEVGDVLRGETIAEVIDSKRSDLKPGELIQFQGGWQSHAIFAEEHPRRVDPRIDPPSLALGGLGMPGLTAYAGLLDLASPAPGDVLLVSAATGGVGAMVGQIGRIKGCRVIGIAGSDEKCRYATETLRFDACINYRTENIPEAIERCAPQGVDIYFDNVGGEILDAAMWKLAIGARVVLCGLMAQYNTDIMPPGPNPGSIIRARATVRGLVVYDHQHRYQDFLEDCLAWAAEGKLIFREDVSDGLAQAPKAFCRLMQGGNFGKTIIRL